LLKFVFVVGIFLMFSVVLKKMMEGRSIQKESGEIQGVPDHEIVSALNRSGISYLLSFFARFGRVGLSKIGRKEEMIEILSTHYIGPKQRIAVVRVCGKKMVLGIASDSISLISQLPDGTDQGRNSIFFSESSHSAAPAFSQGLNTDSSSGLGSDGVRSRVRNRLEGLKSL